MMSKIKATAVVVSTWWPWHMKAHIKHDYPARKFCRGGGGGRGATLTAFFLVDDEKEDPNTTKSGPSLAAAKHHLNGVSLIDDPAWNADLVAW